MSSATRDHEHHHHKLSPEDWPDDRDFGTISAGKMSMWFFLLTDAMSFAGLLLAYGLLRGGSEVWYFPAEKGATMPDGTLASEAAAAANWFTEPTFGIPFTAGLTFLLICSSVTLVMAYANVVEKNRSRASLYLFLTVLGGTLFLCGQMQEYWGTFHFLFSGEHAHGLIANGLIFGKSHYASTFYVVTGFHGLHVLSGVIYLAIILVRNMMGKYDDGDYNEIEIAGLFWHFVDLVWILVFTFVYLIPN
tara:strand:- start:278 stop:1021 length:744 start_codon:yes stop_codon:yes gene_type:complete